MNGEQARNFDLQERLVEYAVRVLNVVEVLPETLAGKHVAGQLVRSGTHLQRIMEKLRELNLGRILFIK